MSDTRIEADDSTAIADAIRCELSLGVGLERFAGGSVPVFTVGDEHVVKLFPLSERSFFNTERAALTHIDGLLSIPTPRPIAVGERRHWLCAIQRSWFRVAPKGGLVRRRRADAAAADRFPDPLEDFLLCRPSG